MLLCVNAVCIRVLKAGLWLRSRESCERGWGAVYAGTSLMPCSSGKKLGEGGKGENGIKTVQSWGLCSLYCLLPVCCILEIFWSRMFTGFKEASVKGVPFTVFLSLFLSFFWGFSIFCLCPVRDALIRVVMDGNTLHTFQSFCSQALICMLIVRLDNNRASPF